jgi:pyruvate kinase
MDALNLSPPGGRQLVATIGPASHSLVRDLARAGATAFRVNASHLDTAVLDAALDAVCAASPGLPVILDLQGAKMRLDLERSREVAAGDRLRFSAYPGEDACVPHPELYRQVGVGDTLSVDDGRVRFEVTAVGTDALEVLALTPGRLHPRKGVNIEQHPVELDRLTDRDRGACAIALRHGVTRLAFSFMADGREAAWLRTAVPGCEVVGKVERREAATHLADVAALVDTLWICRGDLGAQLGSSALGAFVASVDPRRFRIPVLMAGQVLEHLTTHRDPTRSEVCHLYDLVSRGYAGIVLSDETAIGHDPVHAVGAAAALLASFRA